MDALAGLGRTQDGVRGVDADHILDLFAHPVWFRGGQVDLVDHRDDLVIVLDRLVDIGQRLGLNALTGIDDQQRAFAGRKRPADLIGEVDMARGVHQVELVFDPVIGLVQQAHGLRLDRDAAFTLDIHAVEHLRAHLAFVQPAAGLDQTVGKGGFAMVDMGDDGKVADMVTCGHERNALAKTGLGQVWPHV